METQTDLTKDKQHQYNRWLNIENEWKKACLIAANCPDNQYEEKSTFAKELAQASISQYHKCISLGFNPFVEKQ